MLQLAACLTDTETHAFCYAQAMSTTSSTPDDGYLYQLPVGVPLPSTSRPTCSSCSAKLVNLFTETVLNTSTSGANSYAPVLESALTNATTILKQACGSTFAGQATTMQAHVSSGAVPRLLGSRHSQTWWGVLQTFPLVSSVYVGLIVAVLCDLV